MVFGPGLWGRSAGGRRAPAELGVVRDERGARAQRRVRARRVRAADRGRSGARRLRQPGARHRGGIGGVFGGGVGAPGKEGGWGGRGNVPGGGGGGGGLRQPPARGEPRLPPAA